MKDSCWFLRIKENFTQTVMLLVFIVVRLWDPWWGFEQLPEKFSGFNKPSMIHKWRVTFMYVQNEYDEETNFQIWKVYNKSTHSNLTWKNIVMATCTKIKEETKHSQNHEGQKTVARWNLVVWTSTKSTKLSHLLQWKSVDENKMMQICLVCNQVLSVCLSTCTSKYTVFFVWPLSRLTILFWLAML